MKTIFLSATIILLLNTFVIPQEQISSIQKNTAKNCVILLKVAFSESGAVNDVIVSSSSCNSQQKEQLAIANAKKIKINPPLKDGKPISSRKQMEFTFSLENEKSEENQKQNSDEKAEEIIKKAVEKLGGEKYLQVKSQIGRGTFSVLRENVVISFQSFVDVIVFPDKERTEFKGAGKTVQTNVGKSGWIFDGDAQVIKEQNAEQIENFRRGINVSLDNLLRGHWRENAVLSYAGRRQASLGKRNDVVKLTYADGFVVEFEFADDGTPVKSIHKRTNADGEEIKEEDRYAQFIEVSGIKTPFVVDRFTNGAHASRINYESVEFNKPISDAIFTKPKTVKEMKKDLKL